MFWQAPARHLPFQPSGRPNSPFSPCRRRAQGGRCFGKPLRAISRSSHQDTQTPPSPRVGEGGWGDEGANVHGNTAHHASCPRTLPLRGDARAPRRRRLRSFARFGLQDAQTPPSPRVGEGGWGEEGQPRTRIQKTTRRTLPLRGGGKADEGTDASERRKPVLTHDNASTWTRVNTPWNGAPRVMNNGD